MEANMELKGKFVCYSPMGKSQETPEVALVLGADVHNQKLLSLYLPKVGRRVEAHPEECSPASDSDVSAVRDSLRPLVVETRDYSKCSIDGIVPLGKLLCFLLRVEEGVSKGLFLKTLFPLSEIRFNMENK